MAYNAVGTPRIFVDSFLWLRSLGIGYPRTNDDGSVEDVFTLNPANVTEWGNGGGTKTNFYFDYDGLPDSGVDLGKIGYIAYLGHNVTDGATLGHRLSFRFKSDGTGATAENLHDHIQSEEIVDNINYGNTGSHLKATDYAGFSMLVFNIDASTFKNTTAANFRLEYTNRFKIGCASIGTVYNFPHSPDLKLSLTYETGTKTIETKGGASLSNTMWRPPMWGDLAAWELSNPDTPTTNQKLAHSSRRAWDLNFSYLDKTNTFPKYNALNRYSNEALDSDDLLLTEEETLLDSSDFFSQVWNKVGSAYPFIFQPDNSVNEFAICKFDMKNIKFTQVANGVYNIKLKIREVW